MALKEIMSIAIVMFALGAALFVTHFMANVTTTKMETIPVINASNSTMNVLEANKATTNRFDYIMFGLFIGLSLGLILLCYSFGGNPVFMAVYFIVMVISVIVSAVLSNTWETLVNKTVFGTTISSFPISNHILLNLPVYIAVIGTIGLIAMFIRPNIGAEY